MKPEKYDIQRVAQKDLLVAYAVCPRSLKEMLRPVHQRQPRNVRE